MMERSEEMSRRELVLRGSALAAAGLAAVPAGASGPRQAGPNSRLGVGFIGCGGRAGAHMQALHWLRTDGGEALDLVAFCDVYGPRLRAAAAAHNSQRTYTDYRRLLEDPAVDIVCISTPDHTHAPQAIAALRANKHVFVEKPITHWRQFSQLRELARTAARSRAHLLCGTQGMSCSAWEQARKLIAAGAIGQPIHAEAGYFRVGDWGERAMPIDDPRARPGPDLDWEAFLGDAPRRPFSVDRFFRWRLFMDYAGGPVTDLYPHAFTPVVHMLGVKFPSSVVASGGTYRYPYALREVPDTFNLLIDYPEKVTVALMGTQGNNHSGTGDAPSPSVGRAPVIRGWDATLTFAGRNIVITPTDGSSKQPATIPIEGREDLVDFWRSLLAAARSGQGATASPMDLAYYAQTPLIMGMAAWRAGRTARFDTAREAIVV
ncbi:MAG TPA: Gfo/Idh/MocA family oxidoreductase [Chthonomonadales bacterium]|nr:Gfo/Idh/MocA family oxidoreductase [Chthonomonadales bacterium]